MSEVVALRKPFAAVCLASAILLSTASHRVLAGVSMDDLTGPWQLLVDDYLVASKSNVTRTYHPFEKYAGNPVLIPDQPWEAGNLDGIGAMLPAVSGPGYRLWYACLDLAAGMFRPMYATSADGITWTKPNLGIVDYQGSTANNLITRDGSIMHTPWDPDPSRLYKMMMLGDSGRFSVSYSADGIHWVDYPNNPVMPPASDVGIFNYDPHTQRYFGYPKVRGYWNNLKRRAVGYSVTTNIESWPAPYLIMTPDAYDDRWVTAPPQSTQFYGLCGFAYESMYIGFLWIFRATDNEGYYDGPLFVELVSSHDGINWVREETPRPPLLANGPSGAWDAGMVVTPSHPLVEGNIIKIFYNAMQGLHADPSTWYGKIGMATLRKDGFASLDATSTTGTVTTRWLTGASGPLRVNYSAPSGSVKAEILDSAGSVMPGYSQADCAGLQGDSIDQTITWAAHSELPTGGLIQIRFILQNTSLYSFVAGDSVRSLQPPTVTQHPVTQNVCPGGTVQFTVTATGEAPISYRWQKGGVDLSDGGHYAGTGTPALRITPADASDVADYRCVLTNISGSATSNTATIRIRSASFTGIGIASGGSSSTINGMTSDGTVVCGASANKACIWSAANGLKSLTLPSGATTANAVGVGLYNGTVVLAIDTSPTTNKAKRWDGNTAGTGAYANLPKQDGSKEWTVRGLGTNGTSDLWIAGSSVGGGTGGGRRAGRYKQSSNSTVSIQLPTNGHDNSDFHAASDTGVYAGQYQYKGTAPSGGSTNAMKSIAYPVDPLTGFRSTSSLAAAKAISRDGKALGGWSYYTGGGALTQPAIWGYTSVTAVPFISGDDNDNCGEVLALNGDGTIAGGYTYHSAGGVSDGPREAFIWDAAHGTRRVQDVLTTQYGFTLTGWSLQEVRAMSSDGTVIAGIGLHNGATEGWVAGIGHPNLLPTITVQPQSQDVYRGTTVLFTVTADDDGPPAYRWQKNGADLNDDGHYSGTAAATLTISQTSSSDAGEYRCLVLGGCGYVTSDPAALTLKATVAADFDEDGDVDLADFGVFQRCFNGPNRPPTQANCSSTDLDHDTDVDLADFGTFQSCFNGPNRAPACP